MVESTYTNSTGGFYWNRLFANEKLSTQGLKKKKKTENIERISLWTGGLSWKQVGLWSIDRIENVLISRLLADFTKGCEILDRAGGHETFDERECNVKLGHS